MKQRAYTYKHLPIPGGGYVTGFIFHQKIPHILYARTDIGGVYRYDYKHNRWKSLMSHVTREDLSESYPIAIALDDNHPERLMMACGENKKAGVLALSYDQGESFQYEKIPAFVHGNLNGRGTGSRLIVDQNDSNIVYFASQQDGLLRSKDLGKTWETLEVNGERYMTMVWQSPKGGALVVGTAGVMTASIDSQTGITVRGKSLYISYDQGEHFELMSQPDLPVESESKMPGYVAQRYAYDGRYLYITFSQTGKNSYVVENGYSCDSGDAVGGALIRYEFDNNEKLMGYRDLTPTDLENKNSKEAVNALDYGLSGISTCPSKPGLVVCTTICRMKDGKDADCVYRSYDYGETWQVILCDLTIGQLEFNTPYMKPEYNGNRSILHWMSDIKINPFNPDEVWINSGTGVFISEHLTDDAPSFHDQCEGIEETVHLNLYSPPAGPVQLIDILGDLGGFAFTKLEEPCENSFADSEGNRYITCINADYSDDHPEFVVVTPRGNWTGKTKGGLVVSKDQCKTFTRLEMPYGLSEVIDQRLHAIETPNVNSGWVAVSPDCKHIVWSIAEGIKLPLDSVVYSQDGGAHFKRSRVYNQEGVKLQQGGLKVFSDRVCSQRMYGFGNHSDIYISHDGGATFKAYKLPEIFPKIDFTLIDCADKAEIRADAGRSGIFYMALGEQGLWKMVYEAEKDEINLRCLSQEGQAVYHLGLGPIREGGEYLKEDKALYISGVIEGEYGFYSSLNEGKTWTRLNTSKQMFGDINSIEGDSRCFGRFYVGTGSVGVLYGEPS